MPARHQPRAPRLVCHRRRSEHERAQCGAVVQTRAAPTAASPLCAAASRPRKHRCSRCRQR
eukprot:8142814-Lingulodinium_polyedra.AAC.1